MDISENYLNIRPTRGNLIVFAGDSGSCNVQIKESITSKSQLQSANPLSTSQSLPHVPLSRVSHHTTDSSIPNKSTDSNKHFYEIKEFSDAIDAYFSSSNPDQDTVNESVTNQLIDYLNPIPSLFTSSTYSNSLPITFKSSQINSINRQNLCINSQKEDIDTSKRKRSVVVECSKVDEPWVPSVVKKILACYYSELNIKSEFFSNQLILDDYESLVLKEAVQAFQDIAFTNLDSESNLALMPYEFYADPRPIELINSCEKLKSYRKLHIEDKIRLTQSAFFDLNCVKGMLTYDKTIDGWFWGGGILPRRFVDIPDYELELENLLVTFPDCLRNDINIVALLYLIVLFNPDLPKLKFRNSIRQQQYIYIYLLKRYLISLFGSTCESSDYHYLLLAKIEQAMKIPDSAVFEQIQPGSTMALRNHVVGLVKIRSVSM